MEKIDFISIHNVVIKHLNSDINSELEIIGYWYFHFLNSNEEKLSLHIPYYSNKTIRLAFDYTRAFTIVFNLLKEKQITDFDNTCLFDIFKKSSTTPILELTLDFNKQKDNLVLWGENTLTKLDGFLPVFKKDEILLFNKPKTIKNTFNLYKSIRNSNIIDFPQQIKFDEKILSFNSIDENSDELISEKQFIVKEVPNNNSFDDEAADIEEKLLAQKLHNSFTVKFPYSKPPHPYLLDLGKKRFNLIFNNRFNYKDILENDIILLKDDTNFNSRLEYNIINTNHRPELYDLLKLFKEKWLQLELNKFSTPFPKYWLLFLNPSLSSEQWINQFKKDFPAVSERPIIKVVEQIIKEIIELNWIENIITPSLKILFPELKSNRKKRLEFVFNNFKNYVDNLNLSVEFIEFIDFTNTENVLIFDSFNKIDLVNKSQMCQNENLNITVPDFLYFGYNPWIKLHLHDFHLSPILIGLREKLDSNYEINKEFIEILRENVINEIKSDIKSYRSKYKKEEIVIEEVMPDDEDIEYTNVEEIDIFNSEVEHVANKVFINDIIIIPENEKILLQRDTLIYIKAGGLKVGDFVLFNSDILDIYKSNKLYDKLVKIPNDVISFQSKLFRVNNVFKLLKYKGISYQNQNYFDQTYLVESVDENNFRIPRRKKDWEIICEFLNINHSNQQLSFIAYYGRSKQNELKQMYKSIIDTLFMNNWIGAIENPIIVDSVTIIVNEYQHVFNTVNTDEVEEITKTILSTILNQLKFTEITTITYE